MVMCLASMLCLVAAGEGAQAAERAVLFHVPGINSLPAAAEVQAVLKDVDGVLKVRTDPMAHTATILFDDKAAPLGRIRKILKQAKFPVRGRVKFLPLAVFET